jgi:Transposase DDE domain group 1
MDPDGRGTRQVRLLHAAGKTHASFDDPNLVSRAGLVPVMRVAQRCGLAELVGKHLRIGDRRGVNARLKVPGIVAGMIGGADSIDDLDVLRHGAMGRLFGGIRPPSTLGSFLRAFTWGNVRQLDLVGRQLLAGLAGCAPLLPGADVLSFVDIDSTQKRVYGHAKQGAGFGHTKIQGKSLLIRGLNALIATVCTPLSAPVIAGTRLRGGTAGSARGAASFVTEAIGAARAAGCTGLLVVRADSAYYAAAVIAAVRRAGARFSVTARLDPKIRAAIASIPERAWVSIRYPQAIWDDQLQAWISDAQVAEVGYTAFAGKRGQAITARLIVRRVKDLNPAAAAGQGELFTAYRYHAVFTDSPVELVQAEAHHRGHAVVEQVFADLNDGPLAHLPSGPFAANAAWLALAAIAHNLLRAAGCLASTFHAKARGATIRDDLINVAARTAASGRGHITLHLPERWHHEQEWLNLHHGADGPRPPAASAA